MSRVLAPNPSLIAVLLVVGTRNGPRFVFHYPEVPAEEPSRLTRWPGAYGATVEVEDPTTDDSDDGASSDDDLDVIVSTDVKSGLERLRIKKYPRGPEDDESESSEPAVGTKEKGAAWENVLGYSTSGLESLLTPGKHFHKKKFELALGNLVFLSYPVHIREDGLWMKKRERRKKSTGKSESEDLEAMSRSDHSGRFPKAGEQGTKGKGDKEVTESSSENDDIRSESTDDGNSMVMFNVVFVLNPPALEYHLRIGEMYDHVVKNFTKALKYEQARSEYVWKQSDLMLNLREKAKEHKTPRSALWQSILSKSTLARAISEVFLSLSTSKIAHVFLSDNFDISLQIPQIGETSQLPGLMEPHLPGLWLTTANSYDQDESDSSNQLAKHFALLLLDSPTAILKEIEDAARQFSAPLAHYIRCSKPTLSFLQVSQISGLSLPDINILARHLIYWRRARAIPPLHQRDIYIVSPNADMRALPSASTDYTRTFPSLPSLRKILAVLSGPLHPYSAIIPSKDHRPAYLEILAWLVRGGWVTQLRTFAWIHVSPAVKANVARSLAAESTSPAPTASDVSSPDPGPEDLPPSFLSPPPPRPASAAGSTSSASTLRHSRPTIGASVTFANITSTLTDTHPSSNSPGPSQQAGPQFESSILSDPHRASSLESRWIAAVGAALTDPTARELWPRVGRYFNGRHALEKIWAREGLGVQGQGLGVGGRTRTLGRKEVYRALGEMEEAGAIVVARHW
ncbi:MAG: Nitrogen permease regulator 3 [Vezdaea aestivalis]|nr:MAG: Nitrogen permease regulator 3 [Vezdaea aestivalis]